MDRPDTGILFEASWEVCNKVGGIHTVITTKAEVIKKYYSKYILIGPYFEDKAKADFEKKAPPPEFKQVFDKLEKEGITCHYGDWLISDRYTTILIDFSKFINKKNDLKKMLWESYNIDSLKAGWEFDEPVLWSAAVGKLLHELSKTERSRILAHFHEWMAGTALLYLKKEKSSISTVFTTHATILGRSLAGSGYDLYNILDKINPDEKAYELNIQDKFQIEKACAHNADVFTTVSEITAIETEKLLDKKPDILTLNGVDTKIFPTVEEFSIKHVTSREKLREFLTFHFFPYYTFNLNHTMFMFISGRYEFGNKGIDIFIRALGKLNKILKDHDPKRTVAVFFWVPIGNKGIRSEVLENKNYYRHIKNFVTFHGDNILANIVHDLVSQRDISKNHILTKDFVHELKKDLLMFKRIGNPSISTHYLNDEKDDPLIKCLLDNGLDNKKEDNIKVIMNPVYLEGNDGLINLEYYSAIAGCHLGVFPSYYEPWGYTPMEAAAMGVPSITSDLAGFGRFVQHNIKNNMDDGVFILKRYNKSEDEYVNKLTELLSEFCKRDKHLRANNKLNAKELSNLADWNILIENYIKAYNLALKRSSG